MTVALQWLAAPLVAPGRFGKACAAGGAANSMVFTPPDMGLHLDVPTDTQASPEVITQPGMEVTQFAAQDTAAAQQQPPQEPQAVGKGSHIHFS